MAVEIILGLCIGPGGFFLLMWLFSLAGGWSLRDELHDLIRGPR